MLLLQAKSLHGQSAEVTQLLLNLEKLAQFKSILQQMKQGYAILNGGYKTIKDLSEGNFSLHKTFLDGLLRVSPTVKRYRKVAGIIDMQIILFQECRSAYRNIRLSTLLNQGEMNYMIKTYERLLDQSFNNLGQLALVLADQTLRMSDQERLHAIDEIYQQMQDKILFLKQFGKESSLLMLQRKKLQADARSLLKQYETDQEK